MGFDASWVLNLVGQLGGDHQQAAQQLQGMDQVDPQQPAGLLNQVGVDPQQLQNGGYQQHLDAQQQPGFNGYQQSQDYSQQQPSFGGGEPARTSTASSRVAARAAMTSSSRVVRAVTPSSSSRVVARATMASSRVAGRVVTTRSSRASSGRRGALLGLTDTRQTVCFGLAHQIPL